VQVRSFTAVAGLQVDSLTRQLGEYFGVKNGEGVLVRAVEKGSAGEASGVKAGDVIIKVDKEPIGSRSDWRRAMRSRSGKVNLVLIRDKRETNVTLNMPERKEDEQGTIIVVPDLSEVEEAMESAGDALEREMKIIVPQVEESVKVAAARLQPHVKAQMKEFEKTMKALEKRMQEHAKAVEKAAKDLEKI
jgi:C-terminal processing protease CtpA/Prc